MTLTKVIALSLARVGLNTTASDFVDRARDYFNEGCKDISGRRQWKWLFKTSTITTVASQRAYSLASDVSRPLSFIHTTDDVMMAMIDADDADRADPDMDETGDSRAVFVKGINATTGYWDVDVVPTPDTSSETITYRYFAFIEDKTSSDDGTDLRATMPEDAQWALVDYVTARYKGEKGDSRGESEEMDSYLLKVDAMKKVDGETDGNEETRLPRRDRGPNQILLTVNGTIA